jgi:predicted ATPase
VRGEHEIAVLPLPLPCPASGFEELTRNPSVALFADRARAADHSSTLTVHSVPLVAEVCARLDGLPLGIELAAARTRQVRLCSMLERCSGGLALANGGPRDVPERQRTLRATIAWSYDLLGPEEQMLFTCLGVFAGGFTEDAARTVCGRIGQFENDVSEGLESLVEQSLIRRLWGDSDEPRYEMLETIREYALEKLDASGDAEAASRAASEYYTSLAERAELEGEGQAYWLHSLPALQR